MRRRAHLLSCERRAVVPPRRRKCRHLPGRRCNLTCSTHASEFTPTCQECEEWWSASWLRSGYGRYKKRATEVEVQDDSVETGACRSHPNDEGKSKQLEALAKAVQLHFSLRKYLFAKSYENIEIATPTIKLRLAGRYRFLLTLA